MTEDEDALAARKQEQGKTLKRRREKAAYSESVTDITEDEEDVNQLFSSEMPYQFMPWKKQKTIAAEQPRPESQTPSDPLRSNIRGPSAARNEYKEGQKTISAVGYVEQAASPY